MQVERKSLERYRELRAKIVRLDRRIDENTYSTQDIVRSGAPKHTKIIRGLYNGPRLRELREERAICFGACREVEDFIRDIGDPLTRDIFVMRYLEGAREPTWRDIAQRIGGGNSEDNVKQRVCRYLKVVTNVTN